MDTQSPLFPRTDVVFNIDERGFGWIEWDAVVTKDDFNEAAFELGSSLELDRHSLR